MSAQYDGGQCPLAVPPEPHVPVQHVPAQHVPVPQRPWQPQLDPDDRLRMLFARLGVDLVIDVGANLGQFVHGIRRFYHGDVVSFEPNPAIHAALAPSVAADPRWHCSALALGRADGQATLHVCPSHDFSSLLEPNAYCVRRFGHEAAAERRVKVPVRRLDHALASMGVAWQGRRVFLKMDTQGFDLDVFAGVGACLDAVVGMLSELSLIPLYAGMPHWLQGLAVYESSGFAVAELYPVTRDGDAVIEYDCLLVRTHGVPS